MRLERIWTPASAGVCVPVSTLADQVHPAPGHRYARVGPDGLRRRDRRQLDFPVVLQGKPGPESGASTETSFDSDLALLISSRREPASEADIAYGVEDQVKDDLLQLNSVCLNGRSFGEFQLDSDFVVLRFATRQSNDLQDRLINVQAVFVRRRFLDKGADSIENVCGTIAVGHNATQCLAHLVHIGWRCPEPARRSMRVCDRCADTALPSSCYKDLRIVWNSSSSLKGLPRNATAPACIACRRDSLWS